MDKIAAIADKLLKDWGPPRAPYETLTGPLAPSSLEQAYAAQLVLQENLTISRGAIAGRKIALASEAMQAMVGIDQPIAGAIFSKDVQTSPAKTELSQFLHLGLEFELALELDRDVVPDMAPHTGRSVVSLIAAARPAFELIEDKGADYSRLDVLTLVADNAWCGGVVLGDSIAGWRDLDLGNLPSIVHQKGEEPETANTGAADPLGSLAWVLNHFAGRGLSLTKGENIITGSAVRTRFPSAGDRLRYAIAGAAVEVEIT